MKRRTAVNRRSALLAMCSPLLAGCLPVPETGPQPHAEDALLDAIDTDAKKPGEMPSNARLQAALDRALDGGFARQLSCINNGAWQVLHGVLAYGQSCIADTTGGPQRVIPYLLAGGSLNGWNPLPGDTLPASFVADAAAAMARRLSDTSASSEAANSQAASQTALPTDASTQGIRFELEPGSMSGQGHTDQWLAVLLQSEVYPGTPISVMGDIRPFGMAVLQALWDLPANEHREYSWTIIAATAVLPTDFAWTARDGSRWSIERIVSEESQMPLDSAACGGTHRLIGLAMALERRRAEGHRIEGVWADAERKVETAIEQSAAYQNSDGSFATTFLHGYGWSPDMADVLRTTGHVLEVLAIAGTPELLRSPWVERAAFRLCHVLDVTTSVPLECGALYHALHGVILYRQRRFPDAPWRPPTA